MNSVQRSVDHFETSSGPNALFCSLWWPLITARTAITLKAHGVLARSHINPRERTSISPIKLESKTEWRRAARYPASMLTSGQRYYGNVKHRRWEWTLVQHWPNVEKPVGTRLAFGSL